MLRQLSFWALLIVGGIALINFAANRSQEAAEISYTTFTQELDRDNIASVEITERLQVKGTFRHSVVVGRQNAERFTTLLPFESSDTWIATLRTKGVEVRAKEIRPSFGLVLVQFLPYLLILGMIIFMLRQMQQGGNRAFAFGKSKAKLLAGDTPKVTFADVAGCDEAKQELEEIIDFLKDPQKFQRLGGRLPKGALLVGPPGTGKTLLATAVAGEAGRPFFSMSGSDFVEMFVGVGASVTGDTPVLVRRDGRTRLMPIGDFVDSFYEDEASEGLLPIQGVETLGFAERDSKFKGSSKTFVKGSGWKSVSGVYRHRVSEIHEIHYLGGVLRTT